MNRRSFISLLGGAAAAWPGAARAQRVPMRRIGMLMAATAGDPEYRTRMAAFQKELALLGWTEGSNLQTDTRWAATDADDIRKHAVELAAAEPHDVS